MENEIKIESDETVAYTIRDQIVALDPWARARWGVKMMLADTNALQLECARSKIIITLDVATDTYSIKLGKIDRKTWDFVVSGEASGVQAEQLVTTIDGLFREV